MEFVSWGYYSQYMESQKIPWFQSPPTTRYGVEIYRNLWYLWRNLGHIIIFPMKYHEMARLAEIWKFPSCKP